MDRNVSRRMTLNDVENLDGCARRVPRFHGIRRETRCWKRGHLLWIITRRAQADPPLMRLRDFKLGTAADSLKPSFLFSFHCYYFVFPFSPLSESQVNNSSSFTYPTPEFIMEIILFVSSLVLVLGKVQAPRR